MIGDVKPWGRWATLGLGLIALLAGQLVALTALTWWTGLGLAHWADFASDGVAVTLIICISTPVQVLLLALMARQTRASAADYLGLTLPRKRDVVSGIIAVLIFIVVIDGIVAKLRQVDDRAHAAGQVSLGNRTAWPSASQGGRGGACQQD